MNGKEKENLAEVTELAGEIMEGGAVGPPHQNPSRATAGQSERDPGFLNITKETCIWPRMHRLHPTNVHSLFPYQKGKKTLQEPVFRYSPQRAPSLPTTTISTRPRVQLLT